MRWRQLFDLSNIVLAAALIAVAAGLFGAVTAKAASPKAGQFRAACVKVDITPETPQWLQGYGPRQSTGVHDRIYHRIAALDDGTTTFYFGLTKGSLLYLPTKAAFAEGGYEPNVSPFTDAAEADFTSAVTQYLRQLKNEL